MNNRTKILLVLALLVVAVGAWYYLYTQRNAPYTEPVEAEAPPPPEEAETVTSPSARALEILPLPFLVTEAPEEVPGPQEEAEAKKEEKTKPKEVAVRPPPNPFLPLPQEQKFLLEQMAEEAPPAEEPPAPEEVPAPQEVPEMAQAVAIQEPTTIPELAAIPVPQITPPTAEPTLPPESRVRLGVLPVRIQPVEQEVPQPSIADIAPTEVLPETTAQAAAANPLKAWAEKEGLKLVGVALGPVSVAIFATKNGYITVPVGDTLPGTDIRLQSVSAEQVVLVQGSHSLVLKYGGGG